MSINTCVVTFSPCTSHADLVALSVISSHHVDNVLRYEPGMGPSTLVYLYFSTLKYMFFSEHLYLITFYT